MLPCRPGVVKRVAAPDRTASGTGKRPFGDDEELLSGTDKAELTPGQLFDGRGVVAQAISLKRELSVLPLELRDRRRELPILAPNPGGLDESPFAGDPVGQEDGGRQQQQEPGHAAPGREALVTGSDLLGAGSPGVQGQGPLAPVRASCGR